MSFPEVWHTFLQRKVLLAESPLGLVFNPYVAALRFTPLNSTVASLLYVNAVSIFDTATETRFTESELRDQWNLKRRIDVLKARGELIDPAATDRLRERRNEIAHDLVEVSTPELQGAIDVIQRQLEGWGLVGPAPRYEIYAEGAAPRPTDRLGHLFECGYVVGIRLNGQFVQRYEWTEYVADDGDG